MQEKLYEYRVRDDFNDPKESDRIYCGRNDRPLNDNIRSIAIESYEGRPVILSITIDSPKGGRFEYVRDKVVALLKAAEIGREVTIKQRENGREAVIKVNELGGKDVLLQAVDALATDRVIEGLDELQRPERKKVYGVIDRKLAEQIMDNEFEIRNINPSDVGMVEIKSIGPGEHQVNLDRKIGYVDAQIHYASSPVQYLREDGNTAGDSGNTVMEVCTLVETRKGELPAIVKALEGAGIKLQPSATMPKATDTVLTVEAASADQVVAALDEAGLMPHFLATEIARRAEAAHPGQPEVNQRIVAARKAARG